MTTTENNRKRNRSVDNDIPARSKYFVNQRMVDSLDQKYMKKIFGNLKKLWSSEEGKQNIKFNSFADKTVGLLFEGAKNNSNNNRVYECKKEKFKNIRLDGDGNIIFLNGAPTSKSDDKIRCASCGRDSLIQSECSDCNLHLCEYCGVSCANCMEAHLCKHCLQLL